MAGAALLIMACAFAASGRQAGAQAPYRVGLPGKDWAFEISLHDFTLPAEFTYQIKRSLATTVFGLYRPVEKFNDDGSAYLLRVYQKVGKPPQPRLGLEVVLQPNQSASAADFRAAKLREMTENVREVTVGLIGLDEDARVRVSRGSVKTRDYQNFPLASYSTVVERNVDDYNGGTIPRSGSGSKYLTAFYVRDGVGVTVTLSGHALKDEEEKLFYSLLDSIKVVDVSSPASSFDFYNKGRLLYLRKDYAAAVAALTEALARERRQRQLDQTSWRDLVAKLTDSYAMSNDMARVKEVLEYGVAVEPSNHIFQMGLARLSATLGDAENTLAALGRAFAIMKRESPHAPLPDLKNDPAFKRLMEDERFGKAVKELRK